MCTDFLFTVYSRNIVHNIVILKCLPGKIHRSPSYPRGQLQVSLATQAPPFAQGGLHTTVKRQHRHLHLQCINIHFDAYKH